MKRRGWPLALSLVALVVLAFLVPVIAVAQALCDVALFGGTPLTDDQLRAQIAWLTAGAAGAGTGFVAAVVAIAGSRSVAPRVVGAFAIVLSLITGGALALAAWTSSAGLPQPPAAQDQRPDCGIGSQPAVYGPQSRYTACPEDLAAGQAFVDAIAPDLPTAEVTPDAMAAFADRVAENGAATGDPATASAEYGQTLEPGDGTLIAVWVPAPVTCAIFTWDGSGWRSEVTGLLADGGCVYLGG